MPKRSPISFVPITDFSDLENNKRRKTDLETLVEVSSTFTSTTTNASNNAHVLTLTPSLPTDVVEAESQVSPYLHGLISNPDATTAGSNEMQFLVKEFLLKNKPIENDDGEEQSGYVKSTSKRNRIRRDLVMQIKKRLELLSERAGISACLIYMFKKEVLIEGPEILSNFAKDDTVKQTFKKACQTVGACSTDINLQERIKISLPPRDARLTVDKLRQIITTAVTTDVNKRYVHPHWGKPEHKPVWWPDTIDYKSPCSGKNGLHKSDLTEIYLSYWDYTQVHHTSCWNIIEAEPKIEEAIVEVPMDMDVLESVYYINIRAALNHVQCLTKKSQRSLLLVLDEMADNSSNIEAMALCRRLHQFLPAFPTFSSDDFEVAKSHVDVRFRKYASKSGLLEHNYEPVLCRDDGNCLFNAISISLLGVDATSDLLRAISYVHAMAYIDEIDAWIKERKHLTDGKEDVEGFVASYGLDINNDVSTIKDCLLSEARTTLKGGVFSGFLQAVFLAGFLKITIHQHTFIENLMEFNQTVEPVPFVTVVERDCHIMWVPEDATENPLTHVVPLMKTKRSLFNDRCTAIPFYCGAEKLCQHFEGEDRLSDDTSTLSLVQCNNCCRWFHRQCVAFFNLIPETECEDEWSCGCDLTNPWALIEKQKLNDPREIQRLLNNTTTLRALIVNITSNKIVSKRKQLREKNPEEIWGVQTLVTERTTIEYICRKLQSLCSCTMDITFLQDVMLPEVLSWALGEKMKTTRLSAEILMQNINYPDIYF